MLKIPTLLAQIGFDDGQKSWDNRGDKISLQRAIAIYEKAYRESPNCNLAVRLSYAWYFLADVSSRARPSPRATMPVTGGG